MQSLRKFGTHRAHMSLLTLRKLKLCFRLYYTAAVRVLSSDLDSGMWHGAEIRLGRRSERDLRSQGITTAFADAGAEPLKLRVSEACLRHP